MLFLFTSWLRNWKRSAPTVSRCTQTSSRQRASLRPTLETLEDRWLPAFLAPVDYPAVLPHAVAAGDFANNGIQDLAVGGSGGLTVLLGNGDGSFKEAQSYSTGLTVSVAVGDLNADGNLDIVTASEASGSVPTAVSVLLGNGNGTFQAPINFDLPNLGATSVALGDMNHDGRLDAVVAVTGHDNPRDYIHYVDVLLGRGDGSFALASATQVGLASDAGVEGSVILGDFNGAHYSNGDDILDVAALAAGDVAMLPGNGDGSLAPPNYPDTGVHPESITAGDINGDGKLDLVGLTNSVSVLLGNGDLTFQAPDSFALPAWDPHNGYGPLAQYPRAVVVGDLNDDGKMDLAVTAESKLWLYGGEYLLYANLNILLGDGESNFTDAQIIPLDSDPPSSLTAADLNGDAYPDLAVTTYVNTAVLINAGNWSAGTQPSSFSVSGFPSSTTAGAPGSFTVTALNADGSIDTGYTGTVTFRSSDVQAALPASYTFTAADAGTHAFSATLKTASTQSLTVADTLAPTVSGSETGITVTPAAASHFAVSAPASSTAGSAFSVTVTALDPYNNTDTNYTGTIHFTSSDEQASLPANYSFAAGDAGAHTFTDGVILVAGGSQTVTATDTIDNSLVGSATVGVSGATPVAITVSGFPSATTAGTPGSFTVMALDADGSVDRNYTGTVTFSSSDGQAGLPATYTFTTADAGQHTFSTTLKTAGTQSITATDTAGTLTGSEKGIAVTPAAASQFILSAPASVTAGVSFSLTLTVEDAYGNIVTDYAGTVHFKNSKSGATLPANYKFTRGDAGVHTFTGLVLTKTGNQTITVTDTHNRHITGSTVIDVFAAVKQSRRRH